MPRAEHDGVRIYYEDFPPRHEEPGWPDEEGAAPLVLAHGFGVDLTMWDWQLEPLSWRRRLILWDARGHGQSSAPVDDEAYTMPLLAGDLAAVLDHAGIDRAVIGGMSFGGMIALQFAVDFPQRTRALLLSDSVPRGATAPAPPTPEAHGARRAMLERPDLTSALPTLTMPALVIYGERDQRVAEGVPALAAGLPRRRIVCLRGCTHGTSAQRPDAWTDEVLRFLEHVEAGLPVLRIELAGEAQATLPPCTPGGDSALRLSLHGKKSLITIDASQESVEQIAATIPEPAVEATDAVGSGSPQKKVPARAKR